MHNLLDVLSIQWFLPKAAIGLLVGFILRILEHFAYHKREGSGGQQMFLYSIGVLTQSICVGLPLAYIFLAFLTYKLPSLTFVTVAAYLLPMFTAFLAIDLRDLVRRITKM